MIGAPERSILSPLLEFKFFMPNPLFFGRSARSLNFLSENLEKEPTMA